MTRATPEAIEFRPDHPGPVLSHMAALTEAASGWINVRPIIEAEHQPPPGKRERSGSIGATRVGLQHAGGPRVVATLRDLGLPLPEGWRVVQDHPRRGLVAKLPSGADDGDVLDWLIRAAAALCTVPATGRWRAEIFEGIRSN
jgi:hypothetical protein